ncbi:formate dehydrogenase subunit alpha [Cetobacterium sp. 2A]|uniref:formate dehydrogenase subunit alpha n=1 Tax=Cetobacterium sp. 2A TaxID=2754723 RepID=UPI00163D38FE|nr:formate dehydrogenase subunit alpha [Cetobacterium sp. 2A]MBC2855010.1 formate dehydrogenase subunit alpha [Cetobacterium sp. 2A]
MIQVTIDGDLYTFENSSSVIDVLTSLKIDFPYFCHDFRLDKNYGLCGLCAVLINGQLQKSCQTNIEDKMIIDTKNDLVIENRKKLLQSYINNHHVDCLVCPKTGECKLQNYCYQYSIERNIPEIDLVSIDSSNQFYYLDTNKCVGCGRCHNICSTLQCSHAIKMVQTNGRRHPIINQELCVSCGNCVSFCPVGALMPKSKIKYRDFETKKYTTTCTYCAVGCQIHFKVKDNIIVEANPSFEAHNNGLLCVKGKFAFSFVNHPDRLKTPLLKKDGNFVPISWDDAYSIISSKFKDIKSKYGVDSIGGYASAKCTNEENYLFQKFMRTIIGTNNVDHCARYCHASTGVGLDATIGESAMTNSIHEIIDNKIIFIIGANPRENHPVIGSMIKRAKQRGGKLIIADPRKIDLSEISDVYLQINLGSNVPLINGLINIIINEELYNKTFVKTHTKDFEKLKKSTSKYTPDFVSNLCGIDSETLKSAARLYSSDKAAIYFAMGITQHTDSTDNIMALASLALICGNIGEKNTGINPLRGHNNVQGAGDLGCYPNFYPGGKKVALKKNRNFFEKAWNTTLNPNPGLPSTKMIEAAKNGDLKALYIMGENSMRSDPDLNNVKIALDNLEFLVVQDIFMTETSKLADIILPGVSFAEKDGTFTNTERRIQRVRKIVNSIGDAKPDWKIISELSNFMSGTQIYSHPKEIMKEISELVTSYKGITYDRIDSLGLQWPVLEDGQDTKFLTIGNNLNNICNLAGTCDLNSGEITSPEFPYYMTTGRNLYQFHTGTLTERIPGLNVYAPESYIQIHPNDSKKLNLITGDKVKIISNRGNIITTVQVTNEVKENICFMPIHYLEGNPNYLTDGKDLDPKAKIPEFKTTAVRIEKI